MLTGAGVFLLLWLIEPAVFASPIIQLIGSTACPTPTKRDMAKKRRENQPAETSPPEQSAKKKQTKKRTAGELPWHPFWRWLVSLLIVMHLTAVFSAPWDLATSDALPPGFIPSTDAAGRPQPPPRDSVIWQRKLVPPALHSFFHDYLNLLYLNHGYEFFAPDPAGTHIIDYQVTKADGTVVEGRFPSHDEHWPRLLYHRHMMLSEQTQMPAMGPRSGEHYADHLATLHGGNSRLQLKVHLLLPPHRVAAETPLDAPSTYEFIGEVQGSPRPSAPTQQAAPQQGAQQ